MSHKLTPELHAHYLSFGPFTYPGLYAARLVQDLPHDLRQVGLLVRKNIIHTTTLAAGNTGTNADLRFGDMTTVPWWRQSDDDILPTAAAMLAELYRRDRRGLVPDRAPQDKLVVTCRCVALLTAAILKAKGIPCRVRAGHAPYFGPGHSDDHWINQYWSDQQARWVTIDVDGSLSLAEDLDPYDLPAGSFDFPGQAWLDIRAGTTDPSRFRNAGGERGVMVVAWSLFYDVHSIMNDENIYLHLPTLVRPEVFPELTQQQLAGIDNLATLMLDPDANFEHLCTMWETTREYRLLAGALLDPPKVG